VTAAAEELRAELRALGLAAHEARWLVDEFAPGGEAAARVDVLAAAERRLRGEPLQYLLGHWPFRSLDLEVDGRVLIPRPETEELVDHALRALARRGVASPLIVDLGCGSGAIGLSLLAELSSRGLAAQLIAVDASADALAVARRNAVKHRCVGATFVQGDWYEGLDRSLAGHVDLIVSNPPYVTDEEYRGLDPELHFEPKEALVAAPARGIDGFADLASVIAGSVSWLSPRGTLVVEHGARQGAAVVQCARDAGLCDIVDHRDLAGRDRVLVASKEEQWNV
jgi:release factor glutamine methyltransferase